MTAKTAPGAGSAYWVIGGRYTDASFRLMRWSEVLGPFPNRRAARLCWRSVLSAYDYDDLVKFTVVQALDADARH